MVRKVLLYLFFCLSISGLHAQEPTAAEDSLFNQLQDSVDKDLIVPVQEDEIIQLETQPSDESWRIPADSSTNDRRLDDETINDWKNREEFSYVQQLDSTLRNAQAKPVKRTTRGTGLLRFLNSDAFRIMLWVLVGSVVLFVLFKLIKDQGLFKSPKRINNSTTSHVAEDEDISQDFDKLIAREEANGAYRSAVRFQFLKTLQDLQSRGFIHFEKDKLNVQYLREVPQKFSAGFQRVMRLYELVWYGDRMPGENEYQSIKNIFRDYRQSF